MEKHIKILAWLYIALSAMWVLAAVAVFIIFGAVSIGGLLTGRIPDLHLIPLLLRATPLFLRDLSPALQLMGLGNLIAAGLLLIATPGIAGGVGLLMYRPWARILVIVLGILNIISFHGPFGIALGIYTFWVLFKDETMQRFRMEHVSA